VADKGISDGADDAQTAPDHGPGLSRSVEGSIAAVRKVPGGHDLMVRAAVFSALAVLFACAASAPAASPQPTTSDELGRLTLFVSNQSFADDPVGIAIRIDGDVVVDEEFTVKAQDNWIAFELRVPPGEHEVSMRSNTGAEADATLFIPAGGRRWASIAYWYDPPDRDRASSGHTPRSFSFTVDDKPIALA
jgi:hypothetical protein